MLVFALALFVQVATPPTGVAAPAAIEDGNKTICKITPRTGSRLGSKKTCMTKFEWDDYQQALGKQIEDKQKEGNIGTPQ